ncbi:MAG TPA: hypothetical protein VNG93_11705 [Candidatus Dormibacteraeota bacterium]|nr:hypothetical protein [Candidatus Dormibacteraeota bacterium]
MRTTRLLRIALPVAGAVLLAGAAVAITASAAGLGVGSFLAASSTPTPRPSASAPSGTGRAAACQNFLGHLAAQLNISSSKLDGAGIAAAKQTVQDEVAAGKLTQARADKIDARLSAANLCALGAGGAGARGAMAGVATRDYLAAAASALGISETQLMTDLKGRQTLSQVATAQGVSEDQFKAKVVAALKPKLDAAVAAGKLTQAQEDKLLAKFQAGDPPLWNSVRKGGASASPTPAV